MGIVSDKVVDKIKSHILFSRLFSEDRNFIEIKWKNIIEPERS